MLLYFIQQQGLVTRTDVSRWGLDYAFPTGVVAAPFDASGPGGSQGCVCGSTDERLGYAPDRQTWKRIPSPLLNNSPPVWVGHWNDLLPGPQELRVATRGFTPGRALRLCDDREWVIPLARAWDQEQEIGFRSLPAALELNEAGEWSSGEVFPHHRRLWELACDYWDAMTGKSAGADSAVRFAYHQLQSSAVEVLGSNYRVRATEVALLKLFDDRAQVAQQIMEALVDLPTVRDWLQKKTLKPPVAT